MVKKLITLDSNDFVLIFRAGVKLEKIVVKRCKELSLPFTPSEMVSN